MCINLGKYGVETPHAIPHQNRTNKSDSGYETIEYFSWEDEDDEGLILAAAAAVTHRPHALYTLSPALPPSLPPSS